MRDRILLRQLQSLPLQAKITLAEQRIMEWYKHFDGNVYISFSGGKDSTVLTHLVHGIYPDVPLVFANTGLEYPEIRRFAESMGAEPIYPRMRFDQVISKYGYPLISKEVSEAIYYARKIIAKSPESLDSPERERERESTALRAEQDRTARTTGRYAENCRTERQSGEEQTSRTRSRIANNTLTLNRWDGTSVNFSKATWQTGSWSSGRLTVKAKQQNGEEETEVSSLARNLTTGTRSWSGNICTVPIRAYYGGTPPTYEDTGFDVTVDATARYNAGFDAVSGNDITLQGNGTSPQSSKPSFSAVWETLTSGKKKVSAYIWAKHSNGSWYKLRSFSFTEP